MGRGNWFPGLGRRVSFTPGSLPGLALDLRADSGVYSDGARHFTAASAQFLSITNALQTGLNFGTANFTIGISLQRDSAGQQAILAKYQDANNYWRFELDAANKLHFIAVMGGVTLIDVQGTTAYSATATWKRATVVVDRTTAANCKIYLDGVNDTAGTPTTSATTITNTGSFFVGQSGAGTLYYNGAMDSLFIWAKTITAAEAVWTANVVATVSQGRVYSDLGTAGDGAALLTNLVDAHNFDEEFGTAFDSVGTNHLTASNTTLISPTVLNGGFETAGAGGADVFANWTEQVAGSSTVNDETSAPNAGAHACRLDIDASNSAASITQTALTVGNRYSYTLSAKADSGTPTLAVGPNTHTLTTSYATYSGSFTATSTSLTIANGSAASKSLFVDNITLTDLGPVGVPGIAAGVSADENWCGQFNGVVGVSPCLSVASNATLQTGNVGFFVSAYILLDTPTTPNSPVIASKMSSVGAGEWQLYVDATRKVTFDIFVSSSRVCHVVASTFGALSASVFYHVLAWFDPATQLGYVSINGGTADSAACSTPPVATAVAFTIGAYSAKDYGWTGRIDNVVFGKPPTSITLLAATIASTLYGNGTPPKPSALSTAQRMAWGVVSGWDLDKRAGLTGDSIGTNTLTNNGGVTYGQGVNYLAGQVSKWVGAVGGSAVQALMAKRPAYVTSAWTTPGGVAVPGILFDGVDDCLQIPSITLSSAFTAFYVFKLTGTAGIITEHSASAGANSGFALYGSTAFSSFVKRTNFSAIDRVANWAVDNNKKCVVIQHNGTQASHIMRINGVTQAMTVPDPPNSGDTAISNATAALNLGARNNGASVPSSGYLIACLIYNAVLTTSQIQQVEAWLNSRYGVY